MGVGAGSGFVVARALERRGAAVAAFSRVHPYLLVQSIARWPLEEAQDDWSAAMNAVLEPPAEGGGGGDAATRRLARALSVVRACARYVAAHGCDRAVEGDDSALPCVLRLLLHHCGVAQSAVRSLLLFIFSILLFDYFFCFTHLFFCLLIVAQSASGADALRALLHCTREGDAIEAALSDDALAAWHGAASDPPWWWGALCSPCGEARALIIHLLRSGLLATHSGSGARGSWASAAQLHVVKANAALSGVAKSVPIAMALFAHPFARPGCGVNSAVLAELLEWLKSAAQELRRAVSSASELRGVVADGGKKSGRASTVYAASSAAAGGGSASRSGSDAALVARRKKKRKQQAARRRKLQFAHRRVIAVASDVGEAARVLLRLVSAPSAGRDAEVRLALRTRALTELTRVFESIAAHGEAVAQREAERKVAQRLAAQAAARGGALQLGVVWTNTRAQAESPSLQPRGHEQPPIHAAPATRTHLSSSLPLMAFVLLPPELTTRVRMDIVASMTKREARAARARSELASESSRRASSPRSSSSSRPSSPVSSSRRPSVGRAAVVSASPLASGTPRPLAPAPAPAAAEQSASTATMNSPARRLALPSDSPARRDTRGGGSGASAPTTPPRQPAHTVAADGVIELALAMMRHAARADAEERGHRPPRLSSTRGRPGAAGELSALSRLRIAVVGLFASLFAHGGVVLSSCADSALRCGGIAHCAAASTASAARCGEPRDGGSFLFSIKVRCSFLVCFPSSLVAHLFFLFFFFFSPLIKPQVLVHLLRTYRALHSDAVRSESGERSVAALAAKIAQCVERTATFLLDVGATKRARTRAHQRLIVGLRRELCLSLRTLYPTQLLRATAPLGVRVRGDGAAATALAPPLARPLYPSGLGWLCITALLESLKEEIEVRFLESLKDSSRSPYFFRSLIGFFLSFLCRAARRWTRTQGTRHFSTASSSGPA